MSAHRHLVPLATGVALLLALSASAVTAAEPVDPTAESVAIASMLLPSDVDASATTDGIAVSRPVDFDAFTDHDGLRETSQTLAAEGPIQTVYDFRYQFPDAASAKAFLDAAETELGEVWSGTERQALPSSERPVPDTRLFRFEDTLFDTGIVALDYLMRLDTLVAKVYIVEGQQTASSDELAAAIARAAATRMAAALAGETPEASPILRPTPSPSASPLETPRPTPGASGPADAAAADLLTHIPAVIRDGCETSAMPGDPDSDGALARIDCVTSDGASLTFVSYRTVEAMDAAYDAARAYALTFGSLSSEGTCTTGGYDGTWTLNDVEAGRLICHALGSDALVVWSYPDVRILSLIRQPDDDHAAARELWLLAGPE